MIKQKIIQFLNTQLGSTTYTLITPKDSSFGDYAIHQNAVKSQKLKVKSLMNKKLFEKIEEKAGFINFFISKKLLIETADTILQEKERYGTNSMLKDQHIMVEFAHPNTHKLFHIGHLRNIILGESISRILTADGARVTRANYQGDVGLHIAKCLWKIKNVKFTGATIQEKVKLLGNAYTEGNKTYEKDEQAKKEIHEINRQIFAKDPAIMPLWKETRELSLAYFNSIYQRLGTTFDRLYFESEVADTGKTIANNALEKSILIKSEGAVIFDGKKYGVDTRVFINSQGLPTYEAKELGLARLEFSDFGSLNRCIHVVAAEQISFFKTVFKVEELLDATLYKNKQYHLIYGMVKLKSGKMSSREGTVIEVMQLLDEVKNKLQTAFSYDEKTAETVAIAAVKYAFLKIDPKKDLVFDIDESISLRGNSGPYVLYAYARAKSIIRKSKIPIATDIPHGKIETRDEEKNLLRSLLKFPDIVASASLHYSPHLICAYAFATAHQFNLFYEKLPILKAEKIHRDYRIELTTATSHVLHNALALLGIHPLEKL